jgi:hypothetical protein
VPRLWCGGEPVTQSAAGTQPPSICVTFLGGLWRTRPVAAAWLSAAGEHCVLLSAVLLLQ